MKRLFIILVILAFAAPVFAFDASSITFSITSSAKSSAPNLRIGVMKGTLAKDGNVAMQGMKLPRPVNYYLTKSTTHTFTSGTKAIEIQVDQDTKMYTGTDLTNYMLIYSGAPRVYTIE